MVSSTIVVTSVVLFVPQRVLDPPIALPDWLLLGICAFPGTLAGATVFTAFPSAFSQLQQAGRFGQHILVGRRNDPIDCRPTSNLPSLTMDS